MNCGCDIKKNMLLQLLQIDLDHVTPKPLSPASLSARRRSSEHGDVPKSRITSSDPQSKGFFRIHIDSSWFVWIISLGNQIIDELSRCFSFNGFISYGFIRSVCWQFSVGSNSKYQKHHATAWLPPHFRQIFRGSHLWAALQEGLKSGFLLHIELRIKALLHGHGFTGMPKNCRDV